MTQVPTYDPQQVEAKWQDRWAREHTNEPALDGPRRPFYNLMMFPYPSAEGLHVGNMFAFTGADIYGRFKRLEGHDVFEPIGFDAFGIHSENYALSVGINPAQLIPKNIETFRRQLRRVGGMFDWRGGGGELVPPVEHPAEPAKLAAEGLDVLRDELGRIDPHRERVVLRVDTERVEPDGLEHVMALQPLEPSVDVGAGECEHVPHMQAFGRRIGEHHEVVERPTRVIEIGLVGVLAHPALLPLGLDQLRVVRRDLGHKSLKLHRLAPPRNPPYLAPPRHGLDPQAPAPAVHLLGRRRRARHGARARVARGRGGQADVRASRQ